MAKPILPDSVWWLVEPVLAPGSARQASGRRPIADRRALTGILFVLQTGLPWDQLPHELGCGSGMTCLRRLRQWQQSGAWQTAQQMLRENLPTASQMDWSRLDLRRNRGGDPASAGSSSDA